MREDEYLEACPFCKATTANAFMLPQGRYCVGCGSCPAMVFGENRQQAIAAWNRRPDPMPVGNHDLPWWEAWLDVNFGRAEFLQLNRTWKLRRIREVAADLMDMIDRLSKGEGV